MQLRAVSRLTLEPAPEEARLSFRPPVPGEPATPFSVADIKAGGEKIGAAEAGDAQEGGSEPPVNYDSHGGQ